MIYCLTSANEVYVVSQSDDWKMNMQDTANWLNHGPAKLDRVEVAQWVSSLEEKQGSIHSLSTIEAMWYSVPKSEVVQTLSL